jgi:hypothetical protein
MQDISGQGFLLELDSRDATFAMLGDAAAEEERLSSSFSVT